MIIFNILFYGLPINPQASLQSARERVPKGGQTPESFCWKTFPKTSKPSDPECNNASASAASNLTSPFAVDSGCDTAHQSARLDSVECQEVSPQIPKSFRLGAHGGPQTCEGPSMPRPKKQPRQYSRVAESLWDNPDFI
jgi:hypothetical protein